MGLATESTWCTCFTDFSGKTGSCINGAWDLF